MPEPEPDPLRDYKWSVEIPLEVPSAVDRLVATGDPESESGQRCRAYDTQQAQFREDAELVKKITDSPEEKQWMIDINKPEQRATEVKVIKGEDGGTRYVFGVTLG